MAHADFVHLRVHSAYSLSEGALPVNELIAICQDRKMPAVAITDTNNLFGALEFSDAAAKAGVQPIIGCQLSIAREKSETGPVEGNGGSIGINADPMVFLAQNAAGYHNLMKLVAHAYLDGEEASDPQVTLDALKKYSDGLIALTGGPSGPVGRRLSDGQLDAGRVLLETLKGMFPGRLYVEIMRHGMEAEKKTEAAFLDLAYELDLPLVATNEVFFSDASMHEAHDALICIAEGTYLTNPDRRQLSPNHGFKSSREMRALFADLPEAVDNTMVIAKRTAFMVEPRAPILPPYDCGEGRTEKDELEAQAKAGLEDRLQARADQKREHPDDSYRKRLDFELKTIADMGYPGYFLIVADFIRWAKEQGIPVGPGRGSGAGSVVAWSLLITDLDPLRFGLLFERFLNPERVSMPDFDIDFCQDRRDEVIRYVQDKYGRDHVAQIITFGKLQARAVLRDVGRVMEIPYGYVDKISKLVPFNPANPPTLDEALKAEPQLRLMKQEDPVVERLIEIARKLEGLYRHASTHAAGVVIGDRPLDELIPLYRDPRSDMPVTGFSMKHVEKAGLVKFDFLGLKTLTVLAKAKELLAENGTDIDLENLPLDDPATFEMISKGDTTGIFQLESKGMVDVLKELKPDTFEDIIAVVALYRPGPMDNIPSYIKRKHGEEDPDYLYPTLEGILKETFGIMIYQEQVMQIAQELSGYSLGGADILRRAMGKKDKKEMAEQRQIFTEGATSKGVPEAKATDIFEQVNKFAGYGFNKSHAAAYALVAYQTAYMKANHPVEFMAASMTLDMGNTDKLSTFHKELKKLDIELKGPDINASGPVFTVDRNNPDKPAINYALAALKNVGEAAMERIVQERRDNGPFMDIFDFAQRLDSHVVNKRQMENLARAGAFDGLNPNRRQVFESIEVLLRFASIAQDERDSGQMGLFGEGGVNGEGGSGGMDIPTLPDIADWPEKQRLKEERDAFGFRFSPHQLENYETVLKRLKVKTAAQIIEAGKSGPRRMAGVLNAISERTSKKGNRYAFLTFEDSAGEFEPIAFSDTLNENRADLIIDNLFYIRAQYDAERERFSIQGLEPLEKAAAGAAGGLVVVIENSASLRALRDILSTRPHGKGQIRLISRLEGGAEVEFELPGGYNISPDIISDISTIPGIVEARKL